MQYTYQRFRTMDAFLQESTVWKLTCVYAPAGAHTWNFFVYRHISTRIHISYDGHLLCKNLRCGNSHLPVPLRALTVRTSLLTCKCSQVYIFQITAPFVYKPTVCKLTSVCALASAERKTVV